MTNNEEERSSEEDSLGDDEEGLVSEDLAAEEYQAYMTYQNAKSKYKEALKGRGADMEEIKKRSAERLKLAKERSYCSACKRKGHWHKDPECPLRSKSAGSHEANVTVRSAQMCDVVHDCYVTAKNDTVDDDYLKGKLLAIVDTACTKAVAGHDWFERYSDMNEGLNFEPPQIYEHEEFFRFGASRVFTSHFGIAAWFAVEGQWFCVRIAIVPCKVPLLLSRPVLAELGMQYDLAAQTARLTELGLEKVKLMNSPTGHPALVVNDFRGLKPPRVAIPAAAEVYVPSARAYKGARAELCRPLFYPKPLNIEVQNMLAASDIFGGNSFLCWWRGTNITKGFWIETDSEFVRVHVTPRRASFRPSSWRTPLIGLKDALLSRIGGERTTEALLCLSEGTLVHVDHSHSETEVTILDGPWVGRSRFSKLKEVLTTSVADGHSSTVNALHNHLAMAHEESAAAGGIGRDGCGRTLIMDSAGTPIPSDRATAGSGTSQGRGQAERPEQDDLGATHGGSQEGEHPHPSKGDQRALRLLRESKSTPSQTVVPFGRYKGWMYHEVPMQCIE